VLAAVASALGVHPSAATLMAGERGRDKVVDMVGADPACLHAPGIPL